MQEHKLRLIGDTVLRTKCKAYNFKRDRTRLAGTIQFMKDEMERQEGLGISAPQVGVSKKVIVINLGFLKEHEQLQDEQGHLVLINPKYYEVSEEVEKNTEGCLSLPGVYLPITRYKEVGVCFKDIKGKLKRIRFKGLAARCIQHECDHIGVCIDDGQIDLPEHVPILFIDRVEEADIINQLKAKYN